MQSVSGAALRGGIGVRDSLGGPAEGLPSPELRPQSGVVRFGGSVGVACWRGLRSDHLWHLWGLISGAGGILRAGRIPRWPCGRAASSGRRARRRRWRAANNGSAGLPLRNRPLAFRAGDRLAWHRRGFVRHARGAEVAGLATVGRIAQPFAVVPAAASGTPEAMMAKQCENQRKRAAMAVGIGSAISRPVRLAARLARPIPGRGIFPTHPLPARRIVCVGRGPSAHPMRAPGNVRAQAGAIRLVIGGLEYTATGCGHCQGGDCCEHNCLLHHAHSSCGKTEAPGGSRGLPEPWAHRTPWKHSFKETISTIQPAESRNSLQLARHGPPTFTPHLEGRVALDWGVPWADAATHYSEAGSLLGALDGGWRMVDGGPVSPRARRSPAQ